MKYFIYLVLIIYNISITSKVLLAQEFVNNNIIDYFKKQNLALNDISYYMSSYWISTFNGLIKFDGISYKYYDLNEKSEGDIERYAIRQDTPKLEFKDLYLLESNNDELWIIPTFVNRDPNHLYLFKLKNNILNNYKMFVSGNSRDYEIEKILFDEKKSPLLLIRKPDENGKPDFQSHEIYELKDGIFLKKYIDLSQNEKLLSFFSLKGMEYQVIEEKINSGFILKIRKEDDANEDFILDTCKDNHGMIKSYVFQDSILLITFISDKKNIFFLKKSNHDFRFYSSNIDTFYLNYFEGLFLGDKYYGLYDTGLFEYNFFNNTYKTYDIKNCKSCTAFSISSRIKKINDEIWCIFFNVLTNSNNNNTFLFKE